MKKKEVNIIEDLNLGVNLKELKQKEDSNERRNHGKNTRKDDKSKK